VSEPKLERCNFCEFSGYLEEVYEHAVKRHPEKLYRSKVGEPKPTPPPCEGCDKGLPFADDNDYLRSQWPKSRGYHYSFEDVGDSTRKYEGMCKVEREVGEPRPTPPTCIWKDCRRPATKLVTEASGEQVGVCSVHAPRFEVGEPQKAIPSQQELRDSICREMFDCGYSSLTKSVSRLIVDQRVSQIHGEQKAIPAEPTMVRPIYSKFLHTAENHATPLYGVTCNEGWRESIVCTGMFEWAADWLVEQIQGRPYAPERH
jgi:hypothetical protein